MFSYSPGGQISTSGFSRSYETTHPHPAVNRADHGNRSKASGEVSLRLPPNMGYKASSFRYGSLCAALCVQRWPESTGELAVNEAESKASRDATLYAKYFHRGNDDVGIAAKLPR